jgi:hypothetical protein
MKRVLMALVCLLFATALFAQMPAPGPELKELKPFAGNWTCKGELLTSPEYGPGHPEVATVKGSWTLGNFWMLVHFKETKTAKSPYPYDAMIYLSYDGELKKFIFGSLDNTGSYETAQADGWNADEMVFEGVNHSGSATMTARDTFTKKGTNSLSHLFTIKDKDGSWRKIEEDHCTRAK